MKNLKIAIVGSGPAALMAADRLSAANLPVTLFEKRKSPGRKLLVAGSSGLNITNALPLPEFIAHYTRNGENADQKKLWEGLINRFPPQAWVNFIEDLGFKTFQGTSRRYFIEEMKASRFLQSWVQRLTERGVQFVYGHEWVGFQQTSNGVVLTFRTADAEHSQSFDAAGFALGGGSWEPQETPLRWPPIFTQAGIRFRPFTPSNVGYSVAWPTSFLGEAEGKPLKRIILTTRRGSREGDAMITQAGIEGTPVYFVGCTGPALLNLRPDLNANQIALKLSSLKENLSPIRRIAKTLNFCPASFALIYHCSPREWLESRDWIAWGQRLRAFPLQLGAPRPLAEAISSGGGVALEELAPDFSLIKYPRIFLAGEMLSWDAPTGGFLIQGCVAQGVAMAEGILRKLAPPRVDESI